MVYKKTPVPFVMKPGLTQLRKPQTMTSVNVNTNTVMSSFKTSTLNATLKFVKDDSRLLLQYPDMCTEQTEFVKRMITQSMTQTDGTYTGPGSKGLFDPLAEALKIFSLKYEFKLRNAVPSSFDMQRLIFKKIPKQSKNKIENEITVHLEKKSTNHHGNATLRPRNREQKNLLDKSTVKLNKNIAEEKNVRPLNPIPIEKVNTVTLKVNTQATSIPVAKVNSITSTNPMPVEKVITQREADENMQENSMFLKNIDYSNKLNSMPIGKVNKENRDLDNEDFIAIRQKCGPPTPISPLTKKLRSLNTTISEIDGRFVRQAISDLKDFIFSTKETLTFKELRREELEFLMGWEDVIKRVEIIRMFSIPGQMALDELRTMVDMSSRSFKLVVASKTVSPINRTVTFQKKYSKKKNNTASNITQELSDELQISNTSITKPTEHKNIQKVSQSWKKNIIILLKQFLADDLQASLLVPNVTFPQKDFLLVLPSVLSRREEEGHSEDMQRILKDLRQIVAEKTRVFFISMKVKKNKNGSRDVTFMKMPCFPPTPSPPNEENLKKNMPEKFNPKNNNSKDEIPSKSRRMRELENSVAEKNQPNDAGDKGETAVSAIPDKSDASRSIPKVANVTSLPVKPQVEARKQLHSASTAKDILIEALNQPVVSERGLKMMRLMGWEGGALGARGEGIVEPIALNLDSPNRAGLGMKLPPKMSKLQVTTSLPSIHIRRTFPDSPPKDLMRNVILRTIKEMMDNERDKKEDVALELVSQANFGKKTYKFIRQILSAFNSRKLAIDLPPCPIIFGIMVHIQETDLVITACFGASQKNILFVLSKNLYQPSEQDSENWFSTTSMQNAPKPRKAVETNDDSIVVDGDVFKDFVLAQILKFCDEPIDSEKLSHTRISHEIPLRGTLAPKQMSYIKDVIVRLNANSRASDKRQGIFEEIAMKMQSMNLQVDFPTAKNTSDSPVHKCIQLHKIFNGQPTTSTAEKI